MARAGAVQNAERGKPGLPLGAEGSEHLLALVEQPDRVRGVLGRFLHERAAAVEQVLHRSPGVLDGEQKVPRRRRRID